MRLVCDIQYRLEQSDRYRYRYRAIYRITGKQGMATESINPRC